MHINECVLGRWVIIPTCIGPSGTPIIAQVSNSDITLGSVSVFATGGYTGNEVSYRVATTPDELAPLPMHAGISAGHEIQSGYLFGVRPMFDVRQRVTMPDRPIIGTVRQRMVHLASINGPATIKYLIKFGHPVDALHYDEDVLRDADDDTGGARTPHH